MKNKEYAYNILSKIQADNFAVGKLFQNPSTVFYDHNESTSSFLYWRNDYYTDVSEIINENNIKVIHVKNNTGRMYSNNVFSSNFKSTNFQVEFELLIPSIKSNNIYFTFYINNNQLIKFNIQPNALSISCNNKTIKAGFKFKSNIKYNLLVTKENNLYSFMVDGIYIGYIDSPEFTNNINVTGSSAAGIIANSHPYDIKDDSFIGYIYNINISEGQYLKYYNQYSKYATNLISYLNINSTNITGSNIIATNIEAIPNSNIWEYTDLKLSNSYITDTLFSANINTNFTVSFVINSNKKDIPSIDLVNINDIYKVIYTNVYKYDTIEVLPDVTVNEYTTAALNFENGLVDQIGTTIWQKEGTADISSTNKIFGENSFETKALGDSLYTNSKIITGGATPFTIEFYALIKSGSKGVSSPYQIYPLFSKANNVGAGEQFFYIDGSLGNKLAFQRQSNAGTIVTILGGQKNIRLNEINKFTFTYDSSALRLFINDKIDSIAGTLNGFVPTTSEPYRFLRNYVSSYSGYESNTLGLIDNINIHDGIATKVRDPDPYEEFLVVDLAFDGENNSTKIINNGTNKSIWELTTYSTGATRYPYCKLLANNKYQSGGFSYLNKPSVSSDYVRTLSDDLNFNNNDFTIEFEFIKTDDSALYTAIASTYCVNYNEVTSNKSLYNISCMGGQYTVQYVRNRVFFFNEYEMTRTDIPSLNTTTTFEQVYKIDNSVISTTVIQINVPYKVTILRKENELKLYINGILECTNRATTEFNLCGVYGFAILGNAFIDSVSLVGSMNYFKVYNGVAVIPEDPTGKIQLDFDNNVIDKYGNSTWTNNGVTFDQVNSVKGYSAYLTSSNMAYTSSNIFNFGKNNFTISFDAKKTANGTYPNWISTSTSSYYIDIYQRSSNESEGKNKIGFYDWDSGKGLNSDHQLLLNNYYNWNIYKKGASLFFKINDVLLDINPSQLADYSFNQNGKSVSINGYSSSQRTTGYIDNFKTYKEDLFNLNTTYITNNSSFSASIENDDLVLKYPTVINSPVPYYTVLLKDSPSVKNFICEVETLLKSSIQTRLCFRTADFSRFEDEKLGYHMYIADNILRFGVGSNSSNNSWTNEQTVNISSYIDNKYHIFKIISNNNNFKAYIDDNLILSIDDGTHNISSQIAFRGNGAYTLRPSYIKNIKISDLNNNELYYRDWKSKIDNVIDKPAVHLPLETNAINTGFAPLTVNSVGSPTYTTIDGKKCIKFEQGKYLTINSNNIFNLGTSSDFYIEMDIYVPSLHTSGYGHSILNNGLPNGTDGMWLQYLPTSLPNDVGKVEIVRYTAGLNTISHRSSNAVNVGAWNSLKFYRKNDKVYIELNGVVSEFLNDINLNFSNGNTHIGMIYNVSTEATMDGYMSNFKMFVGASEIPETYNDKKVLDIDFKPTGKSYLFKDNNNKCVIHPVNITQRDYQDSQYCCTFNGTNQYLQLGKNDLLNFGNDDFVIEIKFKLTSINKTNPLLANPLTTVAGRIFICTTSTNNFQFGYGHSNGSQNIMITGGSVNINEIYNMKISRNNNTFKLTVNDEIIGELYNIDAFNLNLNNDTWIGRIMNTDFLSGIIYSIKVLRNTTDISLLEDTNTNTNASTQLINNTKYVLTNGVEEQELYYENVTTDTNIQLINDDDTISFKVDNDVITVNKTDNIIGNNVKLFDGFTGHVKDHIKLYNKAIYENDSVISDFIDTVYPPIEIEDTEIEVNDINIGAYNITGYIEGNPNAICNIVHKPLGYIIASGVGQYNYDNIDYNYIDEYEIQIMQNDKVINRYDIVDMGPPGSIKVFINSKVCTSSNFAIRAYRRDSGVFIGEYELDKTRDPYECTVHNLDTTKTYDIMLFDKNNNIESRMMSNRSPDAY